LQIKQKNIYVKIQIQYAAIIRAQKIMHVADKDELIKELKKKKTSTTNFADTEEEEWEFQFAWDRHASFMTAQSRAMAELRNLIKDFLLMTGEDDLRRLQLEKIRVNMDKTKAEIENLNKDDEGKATDDWVDALKDVAARRKAIRDGEANDN